MSSYIRLKSGPAPGNVQKNAGWWAGMQQKEVWDLVKRDAKPIRKRLTDQNLKCIKTLSYKDIRDIVTDSKGNES